MDAAATAIDRLRPWSRGGVRAPHKPLLLLIALRRVSEGRERLVAFPDIEPELRELIDRFSDVGSRPKAGYPFWRLQTDDLWEVEDAGSFAASRNRTDPSLTDLRDRPARGGFPEPLYDALRARPGEVQRLVELVASLHFPDDRTAVLDAVGLRPT